MGWFWATDCAATTVAWWIGVFSGAYTVIVVTILIATAPAFHPKVRRAFSDRTRRTWQWILWLAPIVLFLIWLTGAYCFGWLEVSCYVRNLSFGMAAFVGPLVAAFVFLSARWIGEASAR